MSILLGQGKQVQMIDRTLPEILSINCSINRLEIVYLSWMFKNIGVDFIEINSGILNKMKKLPAGLDFILRIETEIDAYLSINYKIKKCIISGDAASSPDLINTLCHQGIDVWMEHRVESIKDIAGLKKIKLPEGVSRIRLLGMDRVIAPGWCEYAEQVKKAVRTEMDVCPQNTFYNAGATALEAVTAGLDSVSVTFAGLGSKGGFAALEEVLMAVRVLINPEASMNLKSLPEIVKYFEKVTHTHILDSKPVLGKNIFNYESGIHADGIEKNPITYEPYEPGIVGRERRLSIGKHSGKKSLVKKLKEMGIDCGNEAAHLVLEKIREKSIEEKRELYDDEIRQIYLTEIGDTEVLHGYQSCGYNAPGWRTNSRYFLAAGR